MYKQDSPRRISGFDASKSRQESNKGTIMNATENNLIELTASIVSAYVTNNVVNAQALPDFIGSVHTALSRASNQGPDEPKAELRPAVSVKKSVTPEYIICLEDGKKFKSLKRHLRSSYGMSPEEYREKWNLPRDYPMVAPAYAEARSNLAKTMGLGRRAGTTITRKSGKPAGRPRKEK
jgi:predicted transcriptional regulator